MSLKDGGVGSGKGWVGGVWGWGWGRGTVHLPLYIVVIVVRFKMRMSSIWSTIIETCLFLLILFPTTKPFLSYGIAEDLETFYYVKD